jgi:triosephosphate isomerase
MPPFTALPAVAEALKGSPIGVGAQNMHWEREGAFTGEISPLMLRDAGCTYVILGHSERRHIFDETDERLSKKSRAAFDNGLIPMVCVGETLAERESNRTLEVVERQVERALRPSSRKRWRR